MAQNSDAPQFPPDGRVGEDERGQGESVSRGPNPRDRAARLLVLLDALKQHPEALTGEHAAAVIGLAMQGLQSEAFYHDILKRCAPELLRLLDETPVWMLEAACRAHRTYHGE